MGFSSMPEPFRPVIIDKPDSVYTAHVGFSGKLRVQLLEARNKTGLSVNKLIQQCVEYALNNMDIK